MQLSNSSFIHFLLFLAPLASSRPIQCNNRAELNFDSLHAGEYVTTQLKAEFGVTVQATLSDGASSGFTPNNAARVFDTTNPLADAPNDDLDLGSPNEGCRGGGPGVGAGGAPGSPYENCVPLGNVLIIQEEDTAEPDDNSAGGFLTFRFSDNVFVKTVTLFDIDDHGQAFVEVRVTRDTIGRMFYAVSHKVERVLTQNSTLFLPTNHRQSRLLTVSDLAPYSKARQQLATMLLFR